MKRVLNISWWQKEATMKEALLIYTLSGIVSILIALAFISWARG